MNGGYKHRGITFPELIACVLIIVFLVALFMPPCPLNREASRRLVDQIQQRNVVHSLFNYANDYDLVYPGYRSSDNSDQTGSESSSSINLNSVEARFSLLLNRNYIDPESIISPFDIWEPWAAGPVTAQHYSYALPRISIDGQRMNQWRMTQHDDIEVPLVSTRNIGGESPHEAKSNLLNNGSEFFIVAWNDGSTIVDSTATIQTRYFEDQPPVNDYLFAADSPDNALQIHSGE